MLIKIPKNPAIMPFSREPSEMLDIMVSPKIAIQKNSGGPNLSAACASGIAKKRRPKLPNTPPTPEPIDAV